MSDRIDPEVAAEQAYVTAAYARLEAMRAAAERVRTAYADVRAGGTHQARLERDIAYDITHRRLADLDIGVSPLCFGRLDLETGEKVISHELMPTDPAGVVEVVSVALTPDVSSYAFSYHRILSDLFLVEGLR